MPLIGVESVHENAHSCFLAAVAQLKQEGHLKNEKALATRRDNALVNGVSLVRLCWSQRLSPLTDL